MKTQGFTVWFTGLPSSGKSTLSRLLHQSLDEIGMATEILDGDEVRQRLTKGLGFSREDREENIHRIAYVAKLLTRVGAVSIVAAISPYRESRNRARAEIGNFVEVFVQCPLQVCMERDVKGLYAKATKGEILNFTGVSDPYEPPTNPEILLHTDQESPQANLKQILEYLVKAHLVPEQLIRPLIQDDESLAKKGEKKERKTPQWSI